jgi:hypothetical protein
LIFSPIHAIKNLILRGMNCRTNSFALWVFTFSAEVSKRLIECEIISDTFQCELQNVCCSNITKKLVWYNFSYCWELEGKSFFLSQTSKSFTLTSLSFTFTFWFLANTSKIIRDFFQDSESHFDPTIFMWLCHGNKILYEAGK